MTIRAEQPGEEAAIRSVVEKAFGGPHVAELVDGLRQSPGWVPSLSFVADVSGEVVGQVLFTRCLLDAPQRLVDVLTLSPVSVHPKFQGQGLASRLMRHGLEAAASRGEEPLVFLEGDPSFYQRYGFVEAGTLGFRRPSLRIPEPAFQVYPLPSYEEWMTGTFVYSDTFWRHDAVGLR
jgi:putative acetyltransferase